MEMTGDIESGLSKQLKELKMRPRYCLAFASLVLFNDFERLFPSFEYPTSSSQPKRPKQINLIKKKAYIKQVVETAFMQHLPRECQSTFCVAPGIVGCHASGLPLEVEENYGISGILLPCVPGLRIFHLPIDEKQCNASKLIPKELDIKCLLIFLTPYDSAIYDNLVQSCFIRQNSKLALGGSLVERSESEGGSIIAFCGEAVDAASVVIRPIDKEDVVEEKLRLFQETGLLKNKCFALMFSCVARGYFYYKKYNVESSIFHTLYPDVPLIGLFGNGEIGLDYLPNLPSNHPVFKSGKLVRCKKRYLHTYATIFVLISLKL